MTNVKKIIICTLITIIFSPHMVHTKKRQPAPAPSLKLADYVCKTVSVQLCYTDNHNVEWFILPQEIYGTYDDFDGQCNPDEHHPLVSAARVLSKKAMTEDTIGLSRIEVQHFIDITKNDNTKNVIVCSQGRMRNVTYITQFDEYKDLFLKKYPDIKLQLKDNKDHNHLAIVEKETLKQALAKQKSRGRFLKISALEQDPRTKKFSSKMITLRPFYVKKMRSYLLGKRYTQGLNPKVRFYNE